MNLPLSGSQSDVAARPTTRAETFSLLQKPNSHLEAKILTRQSPDRAKINCVERVGIIKSLSWIRRQGAVASPIDEAKNIIFDHLTGETNTPGAKDTTLIIQNDSFT